MKDEIINKQFDRLSKQVNPDSSPEVDVTASVLHTLQSQVVLQKNEPVDRVMLSCMAASVVVACVASFYCFDFITLLNHPAMEIVQSTESLFP